MIFLVQAAADIESRALLALVIVSLRLDSIRIVFKITPASPNFLILHLESVGECCLMLLHFGHSHHFKTFQDSRPMRLCELVVMYDLLLPSQFLISAT